MNIEIIQLISLNLRIYRQQQFLKGETRMTKRLIFIIWLIAGLLCIVNGQIKTDAKQNLDGRIQNDVLGISFTKIGTVVQLDSSTYTLALSLSGTTTAKSAIAQVSVSNRLFVELPGSYGGRFYLDTSSATQILKNRVIVDSVNTGRQNFCREYWVVYAGMGMWDCVINCYVQGKGRYYIVSLVQDKQIGKPGEIVDGKPLKAEDLKLKIVSSLQDTNDRVVNDFNKLVSSFQIHN